MNKSLDIYMNEAIRGPYLELRKKILLLVRQAREDIDKDNFVEAVVNLSIARGSILDYEGAEIPTKGSTCAMKMYVEMMSKKLLDTAHKKGYDLIDCVEGGL